jgi:hypothetical protein
MAVEIVITAAVAAALSVAACTAVGCCYSAAAVAAADQPPDHRSDIPEKRIGYYHNLGTAANTEYIKLLLLVTLIKAKLANNKKGRMSSSWNFTNRTVWGNNTVIFMVLLRGAFFLNS